MMRVESDYTIQFGQETLVAQRFALGDPAIEAEANHDCTRRDCVSSDHRCKHLESSPPSAALSQAVSSERSERRYPAQPPRVERGLSGPPRLVLKGSGFNRVPLKLIIEATKPTDTERDANA